MNSDYKINVHQSSLIDLKAELLRKQAEVEVIKAKSENIASNHKTINKTSKEKKKKINLEKKITDEPKDIESIKALKKSKLMLQAKSRLYEKLSKSHVNMNPNFLVDFEHKPDDSDISEEPTNEEDDYKSDNDSDSDWIEYTDCFGRTRKCLREDLPIMKEKDKNLRKDISEKSYKEEKNIFYVENKTQEKEPEIEMMRKKWEEQTARLANKVDIHYQDVLFDEARAHGVGYYAFSQDEEERTKQQENLLKLRKETEQKQKEIEKMRNMKDKIQQNRLRAARLRQRLRAGLPAEEIKDETINEDNENQNVENFEEQNTNNESKNVNNFEQNNDKQKIDENKLEDIENKIQAYGELLGKRNQWYVMSQEEWVHKRRKERIEEFAPAYENFDRDESNSTNNCSIHNDVQTNNLLDNDSTNTIGPVPIHQNDSDFIGPRPPSSGLSNNKNVDIADQIEVGLKYLRKQFESKNV